MKFTVQIQAEHMDDEETFYLVSRAVVDAMLDLHGVEQSDNYWQVVRVTTPLIKYKPKTLGEREFEPPPREGS